MLTRTGRVGTVNTGQSEESLGVKRLVAIRRPRGFILHGGPKKLAPFCTP